MPGDGFSLAVRVRGQINFLDRRGGSAQVVYRLRFFLDDAVVGLEVVVNVYSHLALARFSQIPNVALRGEDIEFRAEKFLDGSDLRRRLYDEQFFGR